MSFGRADVQNVSIAAELTGDLVLVKSKSQWSVSATVHKAPAGGRVLT